MSVRRFGLVFILSFVCLSFQPAYASKKVYSPIVEKGELEFETTGVYDFDPSEEKNSVQEYKNAIGYGVTNWWATELYGEFERETEEDSNGDIVLTRLKATNMEWENRFQLTEQGKYWLDAGLYFAYEIPLRERSSSKVEGKILLEKSTQNFDHRANIIFEKEVGGFSAEQLVGEVAWSSRYRFSKYFQPGFEYWAEFGELREHLPYKEQTHQAGPVFYGQATDHIKYDIGYLFGLTDPAPQGELKWILEYEVRF
jgi:hypothetical protein